MGLGLGHDDVFLVKKSTHTLSTTPNKLCSNKSNVLMLLVKETLFWLTGSSGRSFRSTPFEAHRAACLPNSLVPVGSPGETGHREGQDVWTSLVLSRTPSSPGVLKNTMVAIPNRNECEHGRDVFWICILQKCFGCFSEHRP